MFSDKFKEARLRSGYTLEQLAEKYNRTFPNGGLNKGTLSKYENNKQEPMITTVQNLATLLDISVDYLLDNKHHKSNADTNNLEADEKELIECYKLCSNEDKEELLMLARHKALKNTIAASENKLA